MTPRGDQPPIHRKDALNQSVTSAVVAQAIFMVDSKGLITTSRGDKLPDHKKQMARSDDTPNMKDLHEIIAHVKPHALIGLSGAGPSFEQVPPAPQHRRPVMAHRQTRTYVDSSVDANCAAF